MSRGIASYILFHKVCTLAYDKDTHVQSVGNIDHSNMLAVHCGCLR